MAACRRANGEELEERTEDDTTPESMANLSAALEAVGHSADTPKIYLDKVPACGQEATREPVVGRPV